MADPISRFEREFNPGRRRLLRTGLGGSLLLAGASLTAGLTGCATAPAPKQHASDGVGHEEDARAGYRFLSEDDLVLLGALLPVILAGSWPTDPADQRWALQRTLRTMDTGISRLGGFNQQELRKLFDLLNLGVTRVTLAGVWSPWHKAEPGEIHAFLERWRSSSLGLLNKGYIGLTKLSNVSWYGARENWADSGYPGPPGWVTAALPQFLTS